MRYPETNASKDGLKRMTVNVAHRIGREEMRIAMGEFIDRKLNFNFPDELLKDHEEEVLAVISKAEIFKMMKECLYWSGDGFWTYAECWQYGDQIEAFTEKYVDKYFPEFV